MQRDVVRSGGQRREVLHALHVARQPPGRVHGECGVVAQHVHAEVERGAGDARADGAQAHDPERSARHLVAFEAALFGFDEAVQFRFVVHRVERADVFEAAEYVAGGQQKCGQHQFLHGVRVRAGRVEDDDAALGAGVRGHVVDAGAGPGDGSDLRAELAGVQPVAAQQDGVRIVNVGAHLEAVLRQTRQAFWCDLVESLDSVHR